MNNNHNTFLSSMTFAAGGMCACDECDENGLSTSAVPTDIREAVAAHNLKKRKLEQQQQSMLFKGRKKVDINQTRELMKREGGISIWKLTLPPGRGGCNDDPIVEYRNSHRILFIKSLPKSSTVLSIGRGIIGSAAEEKDRRSMDGWREGSSYFMPLSKGVACGWIQTRRRDDKNDVKDATAVDEDDVKVGQSRDTPEEGTTDVTIYVLKVSPDTTFDDDNTATKDMSPWAKTCYELFSKCIVNHAPSPVDSDDEKKGDDDKEGKKVFSEQTTGGIQLSEEESKQINDVIQRLFL
eukprot:scaffold154_cov185-Alexandrium_tamarense.AAC.14